MSQIYSLFKYQSAAVFNLRLLLLIFIILMASFLTSQFVSELALINREDISLSVYAEMVRYCAVFWLLIQVCYQINQDYELNQFDWILAMPLARYQYILAQSLQVVALSITIGVMLLLFMMLIYPTGVSLYWSVSLVLELILTGHIALLAAISLKKLPLAVVFAVAIYSLSRIAPLVMDILDGSTEFYNEEQGFIVGYYLFSMVHLLLPSSEAFANSNLLTGDQSVYLIVGHQLLQVMIYSLFLLFITLVDFYRKEFLP